MKCIDLHTHSSASDGTLSPSALVISAKKAGLCAVALTDHDTLDGLEEAAKTAREVEIEFIPGIEFAAMHHCYKSFEIHIIGLFLDSSSQPLLDAIAKIQQARLKRNLKMLKKLNKIGICISYEELENAANGKIITRGHYSKVMLEKGYIKNRQEAFDRYISPGLPGYVERDLFTSAQSIAIIRNSGGIAILAHPTQYGLNNNEIRNLCVQLKQYGLAGIEAMYASYLPEQEREMKRIAASLSLLISGGSDFHGANRPNVSLGTGYGTMKIPYQYLEELKRSIVCHNGNAHCSTATNDFNP